MSQTPASTSSNSNYQSIFDRALEAYKKKTKKDLCSHPLFAKIEACNSPDAVLTTLRDQIPQQDQSCSIDDKLTKWLNPTVNVIYNFSQVIGEGVSLVSLNRRRLICPRSDVHCYAGVPTCGGDLHWNRHPSFCECHLWFVYVGLSDIRWSHWQAAKAISDSQDALAEVFERIENFFMRLETYIEVPPTTGMTDMIVKIMVEVVSILAITTKEIKQSRASEFPRGDMNSHRRLTFV